MLNSPFGAVDPLPHTRSAIPTRLVLSATRWHPSPLTAATHVESYVSPRQGNVSCLFGVILPLLMPTDTGIFSGSSQKGMLYCTDTETETVVQSFEAHRYGVS